MLKCSNQYIQIKFFHFSCTMLYRWFEVPQYYFLMIISEGYYRNCEEAELARKQC